jgi:hypothetical protein
MIKSVAGNGSPLYAGVAFNNLMPHLFSKAE